MALLTLGRIIPLKNAELVATKYTTTTRIIMMPSSHTIARSQLRLLRGAGELTFVSAIKNPLLKPQRHSDVGVSAQQGQKLSPAGLRFKYSSALGSVIEQLLH